MPLKNAPLAPSAQLQRPVIVTAKSNGSFTPQRQNSSASTKISNFFGWKAMQTASSPIEENSPTTISEGSSPAGSPNGTHATSMSNYPHGNHKPLPAAIDIPKANSRAMAMLSSGSFLQAPPTPEIPSHMEEMEEELKDLSEELARSIAREMELEEQLENLQASNKRTSDYYSDSGTSAREQDADEEVRKLKRRSQQEKTHLKVSVSHRVQEERMKRRALEEQVRSLEAQVVQGGPGGSEKVAELQTALDDNRRRLVEERKHKENYEDLIAALRVDLVQHKNERDNLRDEIVPSLQARVDGLETDSQEHEMLVYENTRMQQELQGLRASKFGSILEERSENYGTGMSRSTSQRKPVGAISRSNSVSRKGQPPLESRESLSERVKDVEAQRDALHRALRSLLDRQNFQIREHEKKILQLEGDRDRALEASSPRRRGYEKEVKDLRFEINSLRQRAEDALEQKWQCEKGLGGLKMDLDRAEQETSSLRRLLLENDILVPEMSAADLTMASHATSASLERAYRELRAAQRTSLDKLRSINGVPGIKDPKAKETVDVLLKTMSDAEAERDFAQKQAETFRARAESLATANEFHDVENVSLSHELQASASRATQLNSQVRKQLDANSDLRERLAEAVGKGEREQQQSASRINILQSKLRNLEDKLMAAQQESEDSMALHEEDIRVIRKSNNPQLQRLKTSHSNSGKNSNINSLNPPKSPMYPRSPRLDKTTSGPGMSMPEALRTEFLESRVKALEAALEEADSEMGEVVQRMNAAQIEVLELQTARLVLPFVSHVFLLTHFDPEMKLCAKLECCRTKSSLSSKRCPASQTVDQTANRTETRVDSQYSITDPLPINDQ